MSAKVKDEEPVMHSRSDTVELMINDKEDEFMEGPFHSPLSRY